MIYLDFYRLKVDSTEFVSYDDFLGECGGSVDPDDLIFFNAIWVYAFYGLRGLLDFIDISRDHLVRDYHIPYRTLQSWLLGDRESPPYVVDFLAYAIITGIKGDT